MRQVSNQASRKQGILVSVMFTPITTNRVTVTVLDINPRPFPTFTRSATVLPVWQIARLRS